MTGVVATGALKLGAKVATDSVSSGRLLASCRRAKCLSHSHLASICSTRNMEFTTWTTEINSIPKYHVLLERTQRPNNPFAHHVTTSSCCLHSQAKCCCEVKFNTLDTTQVETGLKHGQMQTVTLVCPGKAQILTIKAEDVMNLVKAPVPVKPELGCDPQQQSLLEHDWKEVPALSAKAMLGVYGKLSKLRLTGLVVITTMAGYAMAPGAFDPTLFLLCSVGTGLTSASANTWNQFLEVPFDAQMNRTRNRPIVTGTITPLHAAGFATVSGAAGLSLLYFGVNPLTAALGLFNLGLYTLAYTPMKRRSIANTWVGSVVGAIPPLMGWAASAGTLDTGALLLGAILFSWQFPHFNSLSWNLRPDYSCAGYRMMSVVDPALCRRVALRHSVALIGLCTLAPALELTTWLFALFSLPVNGYQAYLAYQFYRKGDSGSSRKLFRMTLIHIPIIMILMIFDKKGFAPERKKQGASAPHCDSNV